MCKDVLFSKLILLLKDEIACSKKIKELLDQEKKYLVRGNMPEFEETVTQKEIAVLELEKLEKQRLLLIRDLCQELAVSPEKLSLKVLIKHASALHRKMLTELRAHYRELLGTVKEANQRNNLLLRNSIQYVEYTLNLVTKGKDATYGKSGKKYYAERKLVNRVL